MVVDGVYLPLCRWRWTEEVVSDVGREGGLEIKSIFKKRGNFGFLNPIPGPPREEAGSPVEVSPRAEG